MPNGERAAYALIEARNRPDIRQAWRGPSLLVLDHAGAAGTAALTGFYFRETRYLSRLRLRIQGEDPVPCSSAEVAPNELEFSFIYPPAPAGGGGGSGSGGDSRRHGLLTRGVDLDIRVRVLAASLQMTLAITSRWDDDVPVDIAWEVDADYAALYDALSGDRRETSIVAEPVSSGVHFRQLHDRLPFATRVSVTGGGEWRYEDGSLSATLRLTRQATVAATLRVDALDFEDPISREGEQHRENVLAVALARLPRLHAASGTPVVSMTDRSMRELTTAALLEGDEDEWLMPAAGFPLYPAAFARDAATASWQAAAFDHGALARATAARLSHLQGAVHDDARDEQPGRIIQQARRDPRSRLGDTPFGRYYGDVASPFMYIITIGHAYAWSGDRELVERHWDAMSRVLAWARELGDRDGDGYIEYETLSPQGPRHQGWKDSDNAVVDEHGRQVETPFAPCETQGYYLAALQFMAAFAIVMNRKREALSLWREARRLKRRFNRDFWLDEEGYVAFGLDAGKRPVRVLTSNAAQCIATGIVSDEHLPRLVDRIFRPDLFSGWGIRTLEAGNPAYNPLSYHLGSVWPVENASILFGLRRFGFDDRALELARALYDLATMWPGGRVPECVGGYARSERGHPGVYPRANPFQTWNQSVLPLLLQTLLGAQPIGALHVLVLDPVLPPWMPEVTIAGWRIGDTTASLRFWRDDDGRSHFEVLERDGKLRIVRQPPIESLSAGAGDRLRSLLRRSRKPAPE